jgi:putative hydrolase of the HAD superfamily
VSKDPVLASYRKDRTKSMVESRIQAVVFDMGGTLEDLYYDATVRREATRGLRELLGEHGVDPGLSLGELQSTVLSGIEAYQSWREQTEVELPPERIWTEYVLADHGLAKERLAAAAERITYYYETHYHTRHLRSEAPAVLEALRKLGFRLAIISNVMSRGLVPSMLFEYGIAHLFDPVVTSAAFGWRKPNARIFEEAARLLHLPPRVCAYVGDTVSRDVIGARRAKYGLAIQIRSFLTDRADRGVEAVPPDAVVTDLGQVVELVTAYTRADHDH